MTPTELARARELCEKATPGPWTWAGFCGDPQLEGAIYAAEMNPVLTARGCGNDTKTSAGVKGCMGDRLDDPLRSCPIHPTSHDREFIAASRTLVPALLDELAQARAALAERDAALKRIRGDGWCDHDFMPHGEMKHPKCADMWSLGVIDSDEWCSSCIAAASLASRAGDGEGS